MYNYIHYEWKKKFLLTRTIETGHKRLNHKPWKYDGCFDVALFGKRVRIMKYGFSIFL